ncbi:MAG: hypothetical protein HYV41_04060 [Candidatus Magasanikbacteria bacterium]|nr:hypothetical protein [Candidatus Magasanikbacteria bacterium]
MRKLFFITLASIHTAIILLIPQIAQGATTQKEIGEVCGSGSITNAVGEIIQCKTLLCQESDLSQSENNFCVCNINTESQDCANKYGGDKNEWACVSGTDISNELNYCKKKDGTIKYPMGSKVGITDAFTNPQGVAEQFQSEIAQILQKPQPKINIPGLSFSDIDISKMVTQDKEGQTWLNIPFLGEYISGIYKYAMVILGLIGVIGLIDGGIVWTMSGSTSEGKQQAQKRIVGSLIGITVALTSYILLNTINPELVQFRNLRVLYVRGLDFSDVIGKMDGTGMLISDPNFHHSKPATNATLTDQNIKEVSQKLGLDECLLWAFTHKESGGKLHAIGHDENWTGSKAVGARKDFLLSGKKFSGITFPIPPGTWDNKKHNNYKIDGVVVKNDDGFDLSKPPDYGIDWRFTHGISFLQITIFPNANGPTGQKIQGPNGPEWARRVYGRWYTVTDLLNPDLSIEAAVRFMTHGDSDNSNCSNKQYALDAFKCMSVSEAAMGRALQYYQKCTLTKKMIIRPEDIQKYPAAGSG